MTRVTLENVRVDFPIYGAQRSLRKALFQRAAGGIIRREGKNQERVVVRALDGVSLDLHEGDRLGLMGHNGSGKSTLLKVIAGIYEPVAGRMTIEGRVTPLFDMLPGLDAEDTGYENIFTAGMLLGMSRDYLETKISEIEEFCELGEYLTLPVRTYSAGMTLRLGFAVVTALEPGILLMDEGFGTGDLRFTERAAARMDEFIGRSRVLVLASHSDAMIKSICNKAVLMKEGAILSVGPVDEICEQYHELIHGPRPAIGVVPIAVAESDDEDEEVQEPPPRYSEDSIRDVGVANRRSRSSGAVRVTRLVARDSSNKTRWAYLPGETVTFRVEYEVLEPVPDLVLYFRLQAGSSADPTPVTDVYEVLSPGPLEIGQVGAIDLTFPDLKLMPNQFSLYVWLGRVDYSLSYDVVDDNVALPILVIEPKIKVDSVIIKSKQRLLGVVSLNYQARVSELSGSES